MNCNIQVVTIAKIVNGGYGLAEAPDGKKLFVRHCLPGETVAVEITEEKKRICFGHAVQAHSPVPGRTSPPCPYYGRCGGCNLQHGDYPTQLQLKEAILADLLVRSPHIENIGKFDSVKPIIGADHPFGYRQRIRMRIDDQGNPGFTHFKSHRTVAVEQCLLAAVPINKCLAGLRGDAAFRHLASVTDEMELLLDELSGKVALRLLLKRPVRPADRGYARELTATLAALDRVFFHGREFAQEGPYGNGDTQSNLLGFQIKGAEPLTLSWEIGGFSQVNLGQNQKMIELVQSYVQPTSADRILDLYCGMGNFSIPLARQAAEVVGIEAQGSAIRSARCNAASNRLTNCSFQKSNVLSACRELLAGKAPFDTVVCDPPRQGLGRLSRLVGDLARKKLVYVSCDPATLVRDLQELVARDWSIKTIQPLDMFPQTHHLETLVVLEKSRSGQ
ncbi:MAG: class I SAM-dependent RNA methyltransferase [Desulfofustis sp.]|nr:class I SAM-dependent RNA methyltransferase [Desulfofustis sp.]